jgi:hypothetical protein
MALDPDAAANGVGDSPAAGGDLVPGPAPAGGPTGGETQAVAQTGEAVGEAQDDYGRQAFDLADAAMAGGADCDPELIGASAAG